MCMCSLTLVYIPTRVSVSRSVCLFVRFFLSLSPSLSLPPALCLSNSLIAVQLRSFAIKRNEQDGCSRLGCLLVSVCREPHDNRRLEHRHQRWQASVSLVHLIYVCAYKSVCVCVCIYIYIYIYICMRIVCISSLSLALPFSPPLSCRSGLRSDQCFTVVSLRSARCQRPPTSAFW